jgi:hypothetical protein
VDIRELGALGDSRWLPISAQAGLPASLSAGLSGLRLALKLLGLVFCTVTGRSRTRRPFNIPRLRLAVELAHGPVPIPDGRAPHR